MIVNLPLDCVHVFNRLAKSIEYQAGNAGSQKQTNDQPKKKRNVKIVMVYLSMISERCESSAKSLCRCGWQSEIYIPNRFLATMWFFCCKTLDF